MFRSDRFKHLRESRKYTHAELADLLGVGYAQIYRYEAGKSDPQSQMLDKMADLFNVSVDYLLGRSDSPVVDNDLTKLETEVITAIREGNKIKAIQVLSSS